MKDWAWSCFWMVVVICITIYNIFELKYKAKK